MSAAASCPLKMVFLGHHTITYYFPCLCLLEAYFVRKKVIPLTETTSSLNNTRASQHAGSFNTYQHTAHHFVISYVDVDVAFFVKLLQRSFYP